MSLTWLGAAPRTKAGRGRTEERPVVVVFAVADQHQGALVAPDQASDAVPAGRPPNRDDRPHPDGADSC